MNKLLFLCFTCTLVSIPSLRTYGASKEIIIAKKYKKKKTNSKIKAPKKDLKTKSLISGHGIYNYFGSGIGGGYEYRYHPNISFGGGLSYSQAHLEGEIDNSVNEVLDGSSLRLNGMVKAYAFKYYYIGLNINASRISGDYSIVPSGLSSVSIPFESFKIYPDIFIGSHWDLVNNFFIAVDWIGSGIQGISSLKTESTTEKDLVSDFYFAQSPNKRIRGEINNQLSFYLLVFHFGYRF